MLGKGREDLEGPQSSRTGRSDLTTRGSAGLHWEELILKRGRVHPGGGGKDKNHLIWGGLKIAGEHLDLGGDHSL